MTIILLIASGFFTGLGFLFRYLNQFADWLNWVGVGSWIIACLFAIWAIVSLFQWLIERRRRKAQLWHKRYVDLTAAQHTQKIILEFPQDPTRTPAPYINYPGQKNPPRKNTNKGSRGNGKK